MVMSFNLIKWLRMTWEGKTCPLDYEYVIHIILFSENIQYARVIHLQESTHLWRIDQLVVVHLPNIF